MVRQRTHAITTAHCKNHSARGRIQTITFTRINSTAVPSTMVRIAFFATYVMMMATTSASRHGLSTDTVNTPLRINRLGTTSMVSIAAGT